ncbi:hypothetical protein V1638_14985 [Pseudarthrobacter sp. J64]|uniref:hypothetical protein n=1 Tax=Pseudarthrobacter sp. J64 TaxID=3116485 RepID=UPI002E81C6D5|nr:hypothetical protein [Pseudarthrobacter sp. J64]MEE2570689.1 hypothetical protein [Pseudarthrobacter sp. J64]
MASKFNPPPNWPAAPDGWVPPADWQPDPAWGPLPEGWQLWIDDAVDPPAVLGKRNWFARHKVLSVVGGVLVLGLFGSIANGANGGSQASPLVADSPSPTAAPAVATKPAQATTAPAPKPTPTPTPPAAPVIPPAVEYAGVGDSILAITKPAGADVAAIVTFTHQGGSNFAVWSLDSAMERNDLLVNTIGVYGGTVLMDKRSADKSSSLEITADGPWTVKVASVQSATPWDGTTPLTSGGDNVILYSGKAGAASVTHDGSSNFAIWGYGSRSDLLINEIGPYSGTVRWMAGPAIFEVSADGGWTVTLQ